MSWADWMWGFGRRMGLAMGAAAGIDRMAGSGLGLGTERGRWLRTGGQPVSATYLFELPAS